MKAVIWIGDSKEVVRGFPTQARRQAGFELDAVQHGEDPTDWKPMPTLGVGVREIRIRENNGAFRVIYLAARAEGIYVLHAFQKKTRATSAKDVSLAQARLKLIPR